VLEFVRFAMNAMPGAAAARKRVESLVDSNLAGGRVEVTVETGDGLSYIVSRSAGDETMVLTTDRSPTDINLRSGGLFRVDIFSQNEVEAIADRASSQLDLIDNFEAERIAAIEHRIRALQADLSGNASKITPLQQKADAIAEELNTLPGLAPGKLTTRVRLEALQRAVEDENWWIRCFRASDPRVNKKTRELVPYL